MINLKFNLAIIFLFLLMTSCSKFEIASNERGVMFKRFDGGIDTSKVYLPGKYRLSNYDRMIVYNVDPQVDENGQRVDS